MTKPIGYYVNINIPVVAQIIEKYQSNLKSMPLWDKLFLIQTILENPCLTPLTPPFNEDEVIEIAERIRSEVDQTNDLVGILQALVNSL